MQFLKACARLVSKPISWIAASLVGGFALAFFGNFVDYTKDMRNAANWVKIEFARIWNPAKVQCEADARAKIVDAGIRDYLAEEKWNSCLALATPAGDWTHYSACEKENLERGAARKARLEAEREYAARHC